MDEPHAYIKYLDGKNKGLKGSLPLKNIRTVFDDELNFDKNKKYLIKGNCYVQISCTAVSKAVLEEKIINDRPKFTPLNFLDSASESGSFSSQSSYLLMNSTTQKNLETDADNGLEEEAPLVTESTAEKNDSLNLFGKEQTHSKIGHGENKLPLNKQKSLIAKVLTQSRTKSQEPVKKADTLSIEILKTENINLKQKIISLEKQFLTEQEEKKKYRKKYDEAKKNVTEWKEKANEYQTLNIEIQKNLIENMKIKSDDIFVKMLNSAPLPIK